MTTTETVIRFRNRVYQWISLLHAEGLSQCWPEEELPVRLAKTPLDQLHAIDGLCATLHLKPSPPPGWFPARLREAATPFPSRCPRLLYQLHARLLFAYEAPLVLYHRQSEICGAISEGAFPVLVTLFHSHALEWAERRARHPAAVRYGNAPETPSP